MATVTKTSKKNKINLWVYLADYWHGTSVEPGYLKGYCTAFQVFPEFSLINRSS